MLCYLSLCISTALSSSISCHSPPSRSLSVSFLLIPSSASVFVSFSQLTPSLPIVDRSIDRAPRFSTPFPSRIAATPPQTPKKILYAYLQDPALHLLPEMSTGQLFDPTRSVNYGYVVPAQPSRNLRTFLEYVDALSQVPCDLDRVFNCFDDSLEHRILPASLKRPVLTKRHYREYLSLVLPMFSSFKVMSNLFYLPSNTYRLD